MSKKNCNFAPSELLNSLIYSMKPIALLLALSAFTASAQSLISDLPAVYITTTNGQDIASTALYTTANISFVPTSGAPTLYEAANIRGRGNTLFTLAKKPYKLKLAVKAPFIPSGAKAKKWNLMADHGDKTLLRNSVASFIATQAGQPFAPSAYFVDLNINGSYKGTYRVTDQIDIRKKRVNIIEQLEVLTPTSDISGGYLLEIDDTMTDVEGSYITTNAGVQVSIKSPDEDVITAEQKAYILNHLNAFEAALLGDNWLDPTNGYRKYVDLASLVQWYITVEFAAEPNAFRSMYFYKDQANDKFFFGPVWDFDFGFDNSARWGSRPKALVAQEGRGTAWCYTWINRLRQDPEFHKAVNQKWTELQQAGLTSKVLTHIDQTAASLSRSSALNFGLYPLTEKVHDENHLFSTYQEGVDFLKQFVSARAEFLTSAFATLAQGGTVPVTGPESGIDQVEAADFAVTLSDGALHFRSATPLTGSFRLHSLSGATVHSGAVAPTVELPALAPGIYLLHYTIGSTPRSLLLRL